MSLQMVFAVIVGGLYVSLGPTVGAIITIMLAEILRIGFGTKAVGWDNLVYGVLLVVFIIFLPKGILGSILDRLKASRKAYSSCERAASASGPRWIARTCHGHDRPLRQRALRADKRQQRAVGRRGRHADCSRAANSLRSRSLSPRPQDRRSRSPCRRCRVRAIRRTKLPGSAGPIAPS